MANKEHVELLKRSVREWNAWRQEHPDIQPDLSGADLNDVDLSHADLSRVNLNNALLIGTNLREADLRSAHLLSANLFGASLFQANLDHAQLPYANLIGANLSRANLSGVNLIKANLHQVDLSSADLSGSGLSDANLTLSGLNRANLSHAGLSGANLNSAKLKEADLTQAHFIHTIFVRVNLSEVKGLETAEHTGPSSVDTNSVILPHDEATRLHFLRGVGFTETQIEYLPSLLSPRPIEYASLFISHAGPDEAIARQLHADLRKHDVPCWFALHDLQPGNYFRERIDQAIHTQDKLLLLLSEHSVKSGWVRYEVELALSRENRQQREILFPLRLDDAIFDCTASWAVSLQATRHIGDFTRLSDDVAYQEAFGRLLRDLKVSRPLMG